MELKDYVRKTIEDLTTSLRTGLASDEEFRHITVNFEINVAPSSGAAGREEIILVAGSDASTSCRLKFSVPLTVRRATS